MESNFLFSPNFKYYLNVDYTKSCFIICKSNGNFFCEIPKDMISIFQDET